MNVSIYNVAQNDSENWSSDDSLLLIFHLSVHEASEGWLEW